MKYKIEKRTRKKHPYFFTTRDKSPMYVITENDRTILVEPTRQSAEDKLKKIKIQVKRGLPV